MLETIDQVCTNALEWVTGMKVISGIYAAVLGDRWNAFLRENSSAEDSECANNGDETSKITVEQVLENVYLDANPISLYPFSRNTNSFNDLFISPMQPQHLACRYHTFFYFLPSPLD
ncbi:hypothetical protein BT96DRAFT_924953 [Gymnopus androsaceus JB14]|uniref:Uncharacterized protein n=1 Tax=Gymnopus androsaceus JB14 TaxID=1447944 RepID=A0A6A4H2N2_9AGAR|nr:hypothetical protein BT96DRAFT_924953 [Gymnopus androsaceus JB14]